MTDREMAIKIDNKVVKGVVLDMTLRRSVTGVDMVEVNGILDRVYTGYFISRMEYKKVIYHDPATIVLWADGTKTVVKCDKNDTYDPMLGLALCFMKKALGNKSKHLNKVLHREGF